MIQKSPPRMFLSRLFRLASRSPSDFIATESAVNVFVFICGLIYSARNMINWLQFIAGLIRVAIKMLRPTLDFIQASTLNCIDERKHFI